LCAFTLSRAGAFSLSHIHMHMHTHTHTQTHLRMYVFGTQTYLWMHTHEFVCVCVCIKKKNRYRQHAYWIEIEERGLCLCRTTRLRRGGHSSLFTKVFFFEAFVFAVFARLRTGTHSRLFTNVVSSVFFRSLSLSSRKRLSFKKKNPMSVPVSWKLASKSFLLVCFLLV